MNNKRKVGNLICVLKNESGHSRTDTLPMIVIAFVALVIVNALLLFLTWEVGWLFSLLLPIFAPFAFYLFMLIVITVIAFGWRLLRKLRKGE